MATNTTIYYTSHPGTAGHLTSIAAWVSAILTSGGWVQTSDTGQTTTFTGTSTINTSMGYQIWRMNDALQSTYPVFVKFEYGCGSATPNVGIWITIGTASSGAGAITNIICARYLATVANWYTGAVPYSYFASAATSRVCIFLSSSTTGVWYGMALGIERSKDSSGANTNAGVIVYGVERLTMFSGYFTFTGVQRAMQTLAYLPMAPTNPTTLKDGALKSAIVTPLPLGQYGPQNPGLNFVHYAGTDISTLQYPITVNVRGTNHTYLTIGAQGSMPTPSNWTNSYMAMLYE